MDSSVPSPLETGGAGTAYEQCVGAMFLSHLLTHNPSQVFDDCPVEEVSFQTGRMGWRTDDILVMCSADDGRRKIAIQAKLKFAVGKNPDCAKVFRRFWDDFDARDRFDSDRDTLALATPLTTTNLDGLAKLLECARDSADSKDFKNRLETPGLVQKRVVNHYGTIQHILEATRDVSDERLWYFLRSLRILFLDFARMPSQSMMNVTDMLSRSADGADAKATWGELVGVAAISASGARTIRYRDLPKEMRDRHRPNSVPLDILSHHTKTILDGISATVAGTVTLLRTEMVSATTTALVASRVVALAGPAGSGKSALAKRVILQESGGCLCMSFRAEEFAHAHLDQALPGAILAGSLEAIIESENAVLIHVESLERMLESPTHDAFGDLVAMAERHPHVSLLLTCRDDDMGKAVDALFYQSNLDCRTIRMPPLSKEDVTCVVEAVPALKVLSSRPESGQILCNPYVLDMAARMNWPNPQDVPSSMNAFRERWWSDVVRGDGKNPNAQACLRERTLVDLAVRRARQMRPSVAVKDMDSYTLRTLCRDGLVVPGDAGLAAPAHDVIEDWAVMKYVNSLAAESEWQARAMAEDLGASPAVCRGFRGWLKDLLDAGSSEAYRFALDTYGDGSLPRMFREDVLISVLLSGLIRDFVSGQKDRLLKDDAQLLIRVIHLMRTACTKTPYAYGDRPVHQSVLSEPEGEAWPALLRVVDKNHDRLLPGHFYHLLGLLEDWVRGTKSSTMPDGAVSAIGVAHRLLELLWGTRCNDLGARVFGIIASVPKADSERFLSLVERASSE